MTSKELSKLYALKRERRYLEARIYQLKTAIKNVTPSPTPMRSGSRTDRMAQYVADLTELEALLCENAARCVAAEREIEAFVSTIPDSLIRQIIRLRHIDCLSWSRVALEVGGWNTADGVRMLERRYLQRRFAAEKK